MNQPPSSPSSRGAPRFDRLFVSATGTDAGKTLVTAALALHCRDVGRACVALKPVETDCQPRPKDADRLANVCRDPAMATAPGFVRLVPPLAPRAATLATCAPDLDFRALCNAVRDLARRTPHALVEGAGGLLVPLTQTQDTAHLIAALGLPVLLVAPNRLGVLSHVLCALEAARSRHLDIAAVVLNQVDPRADASAGSNASLLRERVPFHVLPFPHVPVASARALLGAARTSGLVEHLGW